MDLGPICKSSVRPRKVVMSVKSGNCYKEDEQYHCNLCNGGSLNGVDSDAEDESHEGAKVKTKDVYLPSQLEIESIT